MLGKGEEKQAGKRGAMLQGPELSGRSLPAPSPGQNSSPHLPFQGHRRWENRAWGAASPDSWLGGDIPGYPIPCWTQWWCPYSWIQSCLNLVKLLPMLLNCWPGTRSTSPCDSLLRSLDLTPLGGLNGAALLGGQERWMVWKWVESASLPLPCDGHSPFLPGRSLCSHSMSRLTFSWGCSFWSTALDLDCSHKDILYIYMMSGNVGYI